MEATKPNNSKDLNAFLPGAVGWFVLSIICIIWMSDRTFLFDALRAFLVFWILGLFDLYALARAVKSVLIYMGSQDKDSNRSAYLVQILCWSLAKFACLGLVVLAIFSQREAPVEALVFGIATLLIVPLIGGYRWSRRELTGV